MVVDRNTAPGRTRTLGLVALGLVSLAGTPIALAQGTVPRGMSMPPTGLPQATNVNGHNEQGTTRDPMGAGSDKTKVNVDDNLIVDLHVNDENLINVLQMLSIQSQKSILTSRNVSATVTANLYGVTFYEALDAILHVNGYGYIERGNFIFVYTLEELQKIADQQRQRIWRTVRLNYLNAIDAAEFVKPLLSEGGQIKTNGRTPNFQINDNAPNGADDFAHGATMLIFDFEENMKEIEKVLAELDTRPAQVLVEATILQTQLNEANAFGVDFSLIGDLNFTDFVNLGGPLRAVDGLISGGGEGGGSGGGGGGGGSGGSGGSAIPADNVGRALSVTPGNTAGPGTLKLGIVQNDVAAFVRMLDEVADTQIVSRPNILTLNRQAARVLVGRKVGYLSTTSTDTATTQTVQFLDTGTQLHFRPFVSSDGSIRMELKPKVSEAVIRNVRDQSGNTITIPDEITNEITTNVTVRDGQTVVLGGLFRESTRSSRRQVPFAGDIPIIGAAFRGHDDETQRSEIIFMITPSIVNDQMLLDQSRRADSTVERVRTGSRNGLLPWSREKQSQKLVVQATDLAREGRREEALNRVQRALALSPNQPDAIQLRETLMNERKQWPTRSMQHEIISGELERKLQGVPQSRGNTTPSRTRTPAATTTATTPAAPVAPLSATPAPAEALEDHTQVLAEDGAVEVIVDAPAKSTGSAAGQALVVPTATPPSNQPVTTGQTGAGSLSTNSAGSTEPTFTAPSAGLTSNTSTTTTATPQHGGTPSLSAMWRAWQAGRTDKNAPATTKPQTVGNAPTEGGGR